MKNKTTRKQKLAVFAAFIGSAAGAMAQATPATLGDAAEDAVNNSIATVTPIMGVILGFTILAGLIFTFCKKK